MPRNYEPVTTGGYKKHDAEKIKTAVVDLEGGMSVRKTAEKHGIHFSVLYRHWKKGDGIKPRGGQTSLTAEEESLLVNRLQVCGDWGYPVDSVTLRLLVKDFLDRRGKCVRRFKNNLPGRDFVYSFVRRHKDMLALRMCQNIKRARAAVSPEVIDAYFDELEKELAGVPPSNIINYDESNLTDDPGRRKVIIRRGCKYPERIMNSSKSSTSVMFAAAGNGVILPPYIVYRAQHLYQSWTEGGPTDARYNRTKSGWFDYYCFEDWTRTIAIPYLRKLEGKKFLIGDNLSSHLSLESIRLCEENNISFIFLPSNSTHLTQPLDVAFFRPTKMKWREIILEWKKGPGRNESTVPKDKFPGLLKKLFDSLKGENVVAGFKKCGIAPLSRNKVLQMLPSVNNTDLNESSNERDESCKAIDASLLELLKTLRQDENPQKKKKRKKISVPPGKSVGVSDFTVPEDDVQVEDPNSIDLSLPSTSNQDGVRKPQKKSRRVDASSTSECSDQFSLQDSDDQLIFTSSEDEQVSEVGNSNPSDIALSPGDYAVIKVYGKVKQSFRLYVCKICDPQDDGYVGVFLKKLPQTNKFIETNEESFFSREDIVRKLSITTGGTTSRFKDSIIFKGDVSDIMY